MPSKRRCGRSPPSKRRSWRSPPSRRGPRSSLRKLGRSPPSRRGPRSSLRKLGRSPPSRRGVAEGSRRAGRPPEEDLGLKGGMANSRQDKLRRNCACTTAALSAPGLQRWQEKRARQALHKKILPIRVAGGGVNPLFRGQKRTWCFEKNRCARLPNRPPASRRTPLGWHRQPLTWPKPHSPVGATALPDRPVLAA